MAIGPIQAFVIGFPDNDKFEGRIIEELGRLHDVDTIRVIDTVFVLREDDEINVVSVSDLDDEQRAELRAAVGALIGLGIAGEDGAEAGAVLGATMDPDAPTAAEAVAADLIDALPDGSSALVLAIEHLLGDPAPRRCPRRRGSGPRPPFDHGRGADRPRDRSRRRGRRGRRRRIEVGA